VPAAQAHAREEWLARPATLAFPRYRFRGLQDLRGVIPLLDAQAAWGSGDSLPARHLLSQLHTTVDREKLADRSIDAVFPEAWLMASLGDTAHAIAWLDPALQAIQGRSPEVFFDLARAGVLVRVMALRAELAEQIGDLPTAKRWAAAVYALWLRADPFLQPAVDRMRRLMEWPSRTRR
jgi:hypothetical protein